MKEFFALKSTLLLTVKTFQNILFYHYFQGSYSIILKTFVYIPKNKEECKTLRLSNINKMLPKIFHYY